MPQLTALTQSALKSLQKNLSRPSKPEATTFKIINFAGDDDESDVASTVILTEEQIKRELSETVPRQSPPRQSLSPPRRSLRLMAKENKVSRSPYKRDAGVTILNSDKGPMKARSAKKFATKKGRRVSRARGKGTSS
ncbi:uncharacterized protein MELLADRAFT_102489 [Melampsora larici-populina 98AG31]|uniref:Uncharacterized protein n=1 Tax=Melampsora larici-populina (strain 98AG31 / pathotype 3-4-7) TaxID=747676 RepID=F4R8H4_MELLP|nr:uncharacterized protein MELLADRAFT_102489 [Melampsora larici-populina 98AG31]EGG11603.1 hypothetical protein MELLADRAFT_102489 [Melampsora larici-populina 98AG31]